MKDFLSKQAESALETEPTTSTSPFKFFPTHPFMRNRKFIQYLEYLDDKAKHFKAKSIPTFD